MQLTYILKQWKESLEIFLPRKFKIFFIESIKLIPKAFFAWFKKYWWLSALMLIWAILPISNITFPGDKINEILGTDFRIGLRTVLLLITGIPISFTAYAAIIFSARGKNIAGIWKFFFYWLLLFIVLNFVPGAVSKYYSESWVIDLLNLAFQLLGLFSIFFLFESIGGIKSTLSSFCNSLKMITFNLPAFFAFSVILYAILMSLLKLVILVLPYLPKSIFFAPYFLKIIFYGIAIFTFIFFFISSSFMAKFYIKRRQDNPELY